MKERKKERKTERKKERKRDRKKEQGPKTRASAFSQKVGQTDRQTD